MATARHVFVDPDSTDNPKNGTTWAKAYTSLNTAEQTEDNSGDIVTSNEYVVFHCRASSGSADTTAVNVNSWTTGPSNYIEIHCGVDACRGGAGDECVASNRHAGVWSTSKYQVAPTSAGTVFTIVEEYVRVNGLQVHTNFTATANSQHVLFINSSGTGDLRIGNCLLRGHNDSTYTQSGISCNNANVLTIWNTIAYQFGTGTTTYPFSLYASSTINVYGCTVIGGGARGLTTSTATTTVKNTYVGNAATECFYRHSGTLAKINCASSDASATDTGASETATDCVGNVYYSTSSGAYFTNVTSGSENFTIASASSGLVGAGITLTDDPPGSTALSVDIAGTTRS